MKRSKPMKNKENLVNKIGSLMVMAGYTNSAIKKELDKCAKLSQKELTGIHGYYTKRAKDAWGKQTLGTGTNGRSGSYDSVTSKEGYLRWFLWFKKVLNIGHKHKI